MKVGPHRSKTKKIEKPMLVEQDVDLKGVQNRYKEFQEHHNNFLSPANTKNQHGNTWLVKSEVRVPMYHRVTAWRPRSTDSCEAKMNTQTKLTRRWSQYEGSEMATQTKLTHPLFRDSERTADVRILWMLRQED